MREGGMQYIVEKNDTIQKIALKTGRKETEICAWNNVRSSSLFEGQTLILQPLKFQPGQNTYTVCYGDSLKGIAERSLGSPYHWPILASRNQLLNNEQLFIGQELKMPFSASSTSPPLSLPPNRQIVGEKNYVTHIPARSFFFIVADEILPFSKPKAVRKVIFPKELQGNPSMVRQIIRPDKHGFHPRNPNSSVSVGRHVLGMTDSRYISASARSLGSPRFGGKPYWIDMKRLYSTGAIVHTAEDISKDLDRIAQKTKDPKFKQYIEDIRYKSLKIDNEILIEGSIPPTAIKGSVSKGLTHTFQLVAVVGVVLTIHDLDVAIHQSIEEQSIKPIAAESTRQVGGWGGALAGAEIGGALGTALGIETGPGALLIGAGCSLVFGIAGYMGADWIQQYLIK